MIDECEVSSSGWDRGIKVETMVFGSNRVVSFDNTNVRKRLTWKEGQV
jgi:hypothetical protein